MVGGYSNEDREAEMEELRAEQERARRKAAEGRVKDAGGPGGEAGTKDAAKARRSPRDGAT